MDWPSLFERLIEVFSPSYGMVHLFTQAELERAHSNERFCFNGPIEGEPHFTSWSTGMGNWRRPDSFDLEARRRYKFLTELSWANYLGPEFAGQYDPEVIEIEAAFAGKFGEGFFFQATAKLDEVENTAEAFCKKRDALKLAFRPGFFRI